MLKVYLLDDESWQLKSLKQLMNWKDYEAKVIGSQTNSLKAYEEILSLLPDIVVTDVSMPVLNGLDLIQKLQNNGYEGVFIVISGHAEYEYVQKKAIQYDAVDYCLKPIDKETFEKVFNKARESQRTKQIMASLRIKSIDQSGNQVYDEVINYISTHYCEQITLQSVAQKYFLNTSYLSKIFKQESGVTFTSYILEKKGLTKPVYY